MEQWQPAFTPLAALGDFSERAPEERWRRGRANFMTK